MDPLQHQSEEQNNAVNANHKFGRYITKPEADDIFNQARIIEQRASDKLTSVFGDDTEAKDYYMDPHYGYLYSYEMIKDLLAKMDDNSYLVMLPGARDKVMVVDGASLHKGRRTLIAMVYHSDGKGNAILDKDPVKKDGTQIYIGTQHPGTDTLLKAQGSGIPEKIGLKEVNPYK